MKNLTGKEYDADMFPLFHLFIGEIIMDDSTSVTIFGYLYDDNRELRRWDFVCNFQHLTDMLLHAGIEGETLINTISENILEELDGAFRVDAENLFGKPVEISGLVFVVYSPMEKNEEGIYVITDEGYYIIDNIQTIDDFKQNGLIESIHESLSPEETLEQEIINLVVSYKHYTCLVREGVEERQARMDATLANDHLFRLAELYYQIRKK